MLIYLLLRFLPIVLFVAFLVWLRYRRGTLKENDPRLRRWYWAMMIALGITILSLAFWALEQAPTKDAVNVPQSD